MSFSADWCRDRDGELRSVDEESRDSEGVEPVLVRLVRAPLPDDDVLIDDLVEDDLVDEDIFADDIFAAKEYPCRMSEKHRRGDDGSSK